MICVFEDCHVTLKNGAFLLVALPKGSNFFYINGTPYRQSTVKTMVELVF